ATVYGYLLDYSEKPGDSQTVGVRFKGDTGISDDLKLKYTVEYAAQSDYADTTGLDVSYMLID
ncbi:MAG: hypothetical protein GWO08_15300, partial [Gammaproteobacteria bacterium]|nr:hypothetical protein [Gammaproteobacteria bacterium]NIR94973.1 hypothetical protein [Gammaproteobacteria bacterium]NIW45397.1 hypothetical protein [Gammaproteobacteria bacterium]NIX55639.1 hypothetical protein [candidate division Zixibacteria bacterium]